MTAGGLNETPRGERLHIAIFGRRNAGKSSLINALTNQTIAIVSDVPGTTTDPVYKSMEILPVGPVVLIDTAGIDDLGELGELRVKKTIDVLDKADLMLLVVDPEQDAGGYESSLVGKAREQGVPVIGVLNKVDLNPELTPEELSEKLGIRMVTVSSVTRQGIEDLKKEIIKSAPKEWASPTIIGDLINPGDTVVLVVPIDLAAPKGRLILPQVQTIRDILDNDACAVVVKERELKQALQDLNRKPKLVVTDSQAFLKVDADTPGDIMLTSFSILFARHKGNLEALVAGVRAVERLKPGDRVLIAEACTHHRVADDIGTVKIPRWLRQRVGGELHFDWASGIEMPEDLNQYQLIVHCGACMINRRQMLHRMAEAAGAGVPMVNYGVLIAYLHGILKRALTPFPAAGRLLEG
ncbi:[FeFe] hydrogenase H-cluster maturation GTPase HydF [Pelotomaculum sp. PtaB.Bin117]|uniref:[FeFe] hydrogenase H-cluster maturation GTPase HydF n=1 Tax=Pelotomaculum sp. PtaB.Bin117 TaxID=1811694 RepID=UPI0009CB8B24|nr:[FeFe] hydrogenase H-cluster maturation GTPase HydF [Pelotomaculum sp. PtaB.Bin117]OPX90647.1 MAG: tRNA modification GTPase MnmE [Pelotomaculum sp. PtaB.Bin117]OPY62095.1 MAG: tRNA modification GTPase MnmE [Pelotomaculum sp. PtaU1.Bin065]